MRSVRRARRAAPPPLSLHFLLYECLHLWHEVTAAADGGKVSGREEVQLFNEGAKGGSIFKEGEVTANGSQL